MGRVTTHRQPQSSESRPTGDRTFAGGVNFPRLGGGIHPSLPGSAPNILGKHDLQSHNHKPVVTYIEQVSDYWIVKDEGYGNALVIRTPWANRYLELIAKHRIKIIRLDDFLGWHDSDISFLLDIPGIHGVDIMSDKVTDVSAIFRLKALKTLSLYCKAKMAGDFADLKHLQDIGLGWRSVYGSLFSLSHLKRINIIGYPDRDLTRWKVNDDLSELCLESSRLETLNGIECFRNLKWLDLFRCPKLESLDAISEASFIEKVRIGRCSKRSDLAPIGKLSELKELDIEDGGDIQSLAPIAKCRKLEVLRVAGKTTVLDGDFTPLAKMPKLRAVFFAPREHYSHTATELEKPQTIRKHPRR